MCLFTDNSKPVEKRGRSETGFLRKAESELRRLMIYKNNPSEQSRGSKGFFLIDSQVAEKKGKN
ncbi:MAG: hypothetical protein DRP78_07045 [Candidatus Omnitrophota bacterium]|nr:MAG: hypothetical protein DRP78_07045 [Candidatus Omnitrophota bacterium]